MSTWGRTLKTDRKTQLQQAGRTRIPGISYLAWFILMTLSVVLALWLENIGAGSFYLGLTVILINLVGLFVLFSLKVADQWDKAVVLRVGRFVGLRGPGMFWVIPIVDQIPMWIDHRVMVTPFSAEKTLTKDTVPVDVDAVLFWLVWDAEKASLEVEDYQVAISWAAQTALREVIGQMALADILVGRARMDQDLQKTIEDAMSRQAQDERERQARVILGESELQIAQSFADASVAYINNPTALHLRAMNMLFEGLKERGALVIVPSSAVDTMNLGGLAGITSLARMADEAQDEESD